MNKEKVSSISSGSVSVTTNAILILANNNNRKKLYIQNLGSKAIYIGSTSEVTTSNGFLIGPGDTLDEDMYTGAIYGIAAAGTQDVRYIEL